MDSEIMTAAVVAVVTGMITGAISSVTTVASLKVHIQYIKEQIDKHDHRLSHVEREQHRIAGAVGIVTGNGGHSRPAAPARD